MIANSCGCGYIVWLRHSQNLLRLSQLQENMISGIHRTHSVRNYKVTVVGAAGGIGQPLSLLLKQNPLIKELSLHDRTNVKGVNMDLSHICTATKVESFQGEDPASLVDALHDSNIVVVPAGMPRKPDMTRDQLLGANGEVAISVSRAMCAACPKALVAYITNPLNTVVPIAAETMKSLGCYDPKRMFGVTTLDIVRARTFLAQRLKLDPAEVNIPVIGGHAGITILPLLSLCSPKLCATPDEWKALTHRIQEAGTEVVKAKAGGGSATLSMAYAAAHFVNSLLRGLKGESGVVECSYVASDVTEAAFFSTPLELGPEGIKKNLGLPKMSDDEKEQLKKMIPELKTSIAAGIDFAQEAICCAKIAEAEAKAKALKKKNDKCKKK
ncbi:malate dehydrogenase, mitochondrial-like [Drosophila nasuta]|uniref:malate dehydrogenase, mitochondrial-like n=1 Tax=Drosophila nasuta TaxID=42062 RepID=UPI00295E2BEC|nr:malate dehydrogenase, mitochondrial-like [Drosophila nasuta]